MNIFDVIIGPMMTDKANKIRLTSSELPKVCFLVNVKSNKNEIKQAFKCLYGIEPVKINTLIRKPSPTKVTKFSKKNFHKSKKIAYITLPKSATEDNGN